jgi:hypothetical protein
MPNERGTDTTAKALLVGELSILLSFPRPAKEGKHYTPLKSIRYYAT